MHYMATMYYRIHVCLVFLEVIAIVVCCRVCDQFGCRQPDVEQHGLELVLEVD